MAQHLATRIEYRDLEFSRFINELQVNFAFVDLNADPIGEMVERLL
jgi:hypothetical protein